MATIQEILDKINASKSNNINNNSFIDLMRQISGNPEDAVAPVNDANSIYGHIVQMYTELFDGSTNYEEIVANIDAIRDVFNNLEIINSLNDIKAALESIFADKSTLDSIFADKLILDSLYTDKSTFDSLFADKIKFDRIYGSIDNIDRVYKSIDNIDTVIESAANIDILANDIQSVIATAVIDAEVVIVANSAPEIITLADNINTLNEIYTNRDEIYAADENAAIATTKSIEASNSATIATTKASEASASALSASTASNTSTTKATESAASAVLANTSAGSANTSAASASSNATIATTKASEASVSASNASTNAANASTSASAAAVSASTSATKATEAATSASTALGYKNDVSTMKLAIETIYDTFDDRFLGTKTTNPLVDNDGNALIDGALYFDTTINAMKVYDVGTSTWYAMPQIHLNSLLDVELTSLTTGNTLVWNGTKWINYTLSKADVGLNLADNTSDATKNVLSATKLATARTITLSGDVSGSASFDGSANVTLSAQVADDSHNHTFANLTSKPATATRWPTFAEVTGKPATFTPESHNHTSLSGTVSFSGSTGNGYNNSNIEIVGNGPANTIKPGIGFHQPGLYAGTLSMLDGNTFQFQTQSGQPATLMNHITGNAESASTATKLSTTRANYKTTTDSVVVGELMWKNYGNNHTIFDASASISPTGVAVNNTNPDVQWGPTCPTLMGYNGGNSFGVRVDSSRYSESATIANTINNSGNTLTFNWSGQGGQPTWLYGGNDPSNAYVYNPSNFSVNYANSAGYAATVAAATPTSVGGIKARLDGTTLFITTNGNNA